jgi:ferredoxin
MPTITVRGHKSFECGVGNSLAYELTQAGIDISHHCGGKAQCTTCRVQFLSPEPPMRDPERAELESEQVIGQFRLACQIPVEEDMSVVILMPAAKMCWEPGPALEA